MDYVEIITAEVRKRSASGVPLSALNNFNEKDFPGVDFKEMCEVLKSRGYIKKTYIRSFCLEDAVIEDILS